MQQDKDFIVVKDSESRIDGKPSQSINENSMIYASKDSKDKHNKSNQGTIEGTKAGNNASSNSNQIASQPQKGTRNEQQQLKVETQKPKNTGGIFTGIGKLYDKGKQMLGMADQNKPEPAVQHLHQQISEQSSRYVSTSNQSGSYQNANHSNHQRSQNNQGLQQSQNIQPETQAEYEGVLKEIINQDLDTVEKIRFDAQYNYLTAAELMVEDVIK